MLGLALGFAYILPRGLFRDWWVAIRKNWGLLLVFLFLAESPDLDLLPGLLIGNLNAFHHIYTHTLGWVFLVSLGLYLCWRPFHPKDGWRCLLFFFLASLSHLVVDYMTQDTSYPYGVMGFWPFYRDYVLSKYALFLGPEKSTVAAIFQWHNVKVMVLDFLVCLPVLLAVCAYKWTGWRRGVQPETAAEIHAHAR
jgi:inner membrane protein